MKIRRLSVYMVALILFAACKKDEPQSPVAPTAPQPTDFLVSVANEGPFMTGSGTISLINLSAQTVQNDVFAAANGFPLGNIVQSTFRSGDLLFAVVNNAAKIEVMSFPSMQSVSVISGFSSPRYMIEAMGKGFVSDWSADGVVRVVDLNTFQITSDIPAGQGPDRMLLHSGKLFVLNSGGFGNDNTITVIDPETTSVTDVLEVGYRPHSIAVDVDGMLRVLCSGIGSWPDPEAQTPGSVHVIDPQTLETTNLFTMPDATQHPRHLVSNATGTDFWYLLDGNVFHLAASDMDFPANPLIEGSFYSLGYHPGADFILAADAADFQQNGTVHIFSPSGIETAAYPAGIIPSDLLPL
jgi:YVTN family beta-propeller protein